MNALKQFFSIMIIAAAASIAHHSQAVEGKAMRLAVAGISHGHLAEVINRADRGDFVIVGVFESDQALRENNRLRAKVAPALFYGKLEQMLEETKPEVVVAYGSIYDHLSVVEACAPRGVHVMVEKPLAVSVAHAERMAELSRKHNIHLLTNYETTWYATNHEAFRLIDSRAIGSITRINVYDGHKGPIEIGCSPEFLSWLTDPVGNGGGAVMDFGCYGANLSTRLMNGEKPLKVYASLLQQKPDKYPLVDDDATVLLQYPAATVQIMASWNWPMGRKDMHIYGSQGYICQDTPQSMRIYVDGKERTETPPALQPPYNDSFLYLKAVVRGEISLKATDLSALENNLTVVRILEAAVKSARSGGPVIP